MREKCSSDSEEIGDSDSGLNVYRLQKTKKFKRKEKKMTMKQDLKALQKDIKALEKKMNKLIAEAEKNDKSKSTKKTLTGSSVKTKTTKNSPPKKAAAKKKPRKVTATDIVLGAIAAQKKGISVANLIKRTRFEEKKIQNIIYKASKNGKIKRVGKGVYIGV